MVFNGDEKNTVVINAVVRAALYSALKNSAFE